MSLSLSQSFSVHLLENWKKSWPIFLSKDNAVQFKKFGKLSCARSHLHHTCAHTQPYAAYAPSVTFCHVLAKVCWMNITTHRVSSEPLLIDLSSKYVQRQKRCLSYQLRERSQACKHEKANQRQYDQRVRDVKAGPPWGYFRGFGRRDLVFLFESSCKKMKNDTTFLCMRSGDHLGDAKMSKKGTSLRRT